MVNGKMIREMDSELKYGLMETNMKGNGKMIKEKDKEFYIGRMEISIQDSLKIIRYLVSDVCLILKIT